MADVSFTATAIKATATTLTEPGTLGEASITQGMALYKSSGKWYIADCTTSATTAAASGIALGAGGTDQRIQIATGGDITVDNLSISAAGDKGVYVLSAAGKIAPAADLAEDDYLTIIGAASAATTLKLAFKATGVQITA